jgi:hypothetical protein
LIAHVYEELEVPANNSSKPQEVLRSWKNQEGVAKSIHIKKEGK